MQIRKIFKWLPVPIFTSSLLTRGRWGRSYWLFITTRKQYSQDEGLIQHELLHCEQMWKTCFVGYAMLYFFSKKFRQDVEVAAYKVHVSHGSLSLQGAAVLLVCEYGLDLTIDEAIKLLEE